MNDSSTILSCPLCCEENISDGVMVLSICKHQSCRSCLVKWIEREEASGQSTPPTCPFCRSMIGDGDVYEILQRHFQPRECRAVNSEEDNDDADVLDELTLQWMNEHTVTCGGCGIGIEKSDGCDLMECLCGYRFCYRCGVAGGECNCNPGHIFVSDACFLNDRNEGTYEPIRDEHGYVDIRSTIDRRERQRQQRLDLMCPRGHTDLTSILNQLIQPRTNHRLDTMQEESSGRTAGMIHTDDSTISSVSISFIEDSSSEDEEVDNIIRRVFESVYDDLDKNGLSVDDEKDDDDAVSSIGASVNFIPSFKDSSKSLDCVDFSSIESQQHEESEPISYWSNSDASRDRESIACDLSVGVSISSVHFCPSLFEESECESLESCDIPSIEFHFNENDTGKSYDESRKSNISTQNGRWLFCSKKKSGSISMLVQQLRYDFLVHDRGHQSCERRSEVINRWGYSPIHAEACPSNGRWLYSSKSNAGSVSMLVQQLGRSCEFDERICERVEELD